MAAEKRKSYIKAENRPKIRPDFTFSDHLTETLSVIGLIALWALVVIALNVLPDIIPVHFDFKGNPDGYGDKATLIFLPILTTILYAGLTVINRYPHIFNYPVKITEENALKHYTNATRMIRLLKLIIILMFSVIVFYQYRTSTGQSEGLGIWFIPIFLGVIYIPLIFFLIKSFSSK